MTEKVPTSSNDVRFFRDHSLRVVELLDPRPGEHILDIGCGDGELSARLCERGAMVTGIDIDPAAVASARERGINAIAQDAQVLRLPAQFDAVFSHAAIHWMPDAESVFNGAWRALKSGGKFVAETGAHRNIAAIHTALIATLLRFNVQEERIPRFFYPAADECCDLLEACGFSVTMIQTFHRPTPLPLGIHAWLKMFAKPFFDTVPEACREEAMQYAEYLLAPVLKTSRGDWVADYVHLRFKALKRAL